MASVKIVWGKPYPDGTIPISIRIISGRQQYPKLICRIPEDHWDEKRLQVRSKNNHHVKYNQLIHKAYTEAKEYLLDCQINKVPVDAAGFLHGSKSGSMVTDHLAAKRDRCKSFRTKGRYDTMIGRILDAGLDVKIIIADKKWVRKLDDYFRSIGNNDNTRSKYITDIKSVFLLALKEGVIKTNPFIDWHKSSTPGKKAKLTRVEFTRLRSLQLNGHLQIVRDLFVFTVLARGMRAFDVLTLLWTNIQGDRLRYRADKKGEGKEGKSFDILITADMQGILDSLDRSDQYVWPFVKLPKKILQADEKKYKKHVDSVLTPINEDLKELATLASIDKNISMHVARHTFAYLSLKAKLGLEQIQHMLGHEDITTTILYTEAIMYAEEMDQAAGEVFG